MESNDRVLSIIPARGGSKGLPGKNFKSFAGFPLIAHSIFLAKSCPFITRTIVSTDSQDIVRAAKAHGGDVPFLRPHELAQDDTPLWPVLRHALEEAEKQENKKYDYILLLDPTTPCRTKKNLEEAFLKISNAPPADGVIGVSKPDFNPIWNCVIESDGFMKSMFPEGDTVHRRQDAPSVFRINGSLYIWRAQFVHRQEKNWRDSGKFVMYEVPDFYSISIDTEEEFKRAELYVKNGLIEFPWLKKETV